MVIRYYLSISQTSKDSQIAQRGGPCTCFRVKSVVDSDSIRLFVHWLTSIDDIGNKRLLLPIQDQLWIDSLLLSFFDGWILTSYNSAFHWIYVSMVEVLPIQQEVLLLIDHRGIHLLPLTWSHIQWLNENEQSTVYSELFLTVFCFIWSNLKCLERRKRELFAVEEDDSSQDRRGSHFNTRLSMDSLSLSRVTIGKEYRRRDHTLVSFLWSSLWHLGLVIISCEMTP